jgi:hypothetical protein
LPRADFGWEKEEGGTKIDHGKIRTEPAHPTLKEGWPHEYKVNSFHGSLKIYMTKISVW